MARLIWDNIGERYYETGVEQAVLYVRDATGAYPEGVVWNGLTTVTESPSGAEATPLYADNIKYLNLVSAEEFGATVEAYTYPPEFEACEGSKELSKGVLVSQQARAGFGLSYKTKLGNDVSGDEYGYKIHIIYNAIAAPTDKARNTINDSPEATTFSWELSTTPIPVPGMKPSAKLTIDSTLIEPDKLAAIEDILYGSTTESGKARLPLPAEIVTILASA